MLAAAIPVALSFYMIFSPPAGLETTKLFLRLICFSVLLHFFMTLFFVPQLAFGGEVSKDYHERPTINEARVNSKPIDEYSCTQHALL
jgi:GPH family glycoside/pentoside/hexuronide:cation symporter